jgi:hypothetical protein
MCRRRGDAATKTARPDRRTDHHQIIEVTPLAPLGE